MSTQKFSPTLNSGYNLYNPTSKIDKTSLSFSMWETTLKISIIPVIDSASNDYPKYDYKSASSIFLSPIKAHLFAQVLSKFKENPDEYNNVGISSPQAIITVEKPDRFGYPKGGPVITIRKLREDGALESSYSYECNYESFSAITGFNVDDPKNFQKNIEMFKDAELDAIINQLESYYKAATNAGAFTTLKAIYPYMDKIACKLGVDLSSSNYRDSKSPGFFSKALPSTPTIDDMRSQQPMDYDAEELQSLIMK